MVQLRGWVHPVHVSIDPDTGSTTSHVFERQALGHGLEYTDGYLLLSTETSSPDGIRVMTVDCDDDGDGFCNADDNCLRSPTRPRPMPTATNGRCL